MTETALDPKDPDLLVKIGQILDRTIRGEKPNKLLLFLICLSSVTDNPLSGVVKGLSSSGKSTLVKSVLEIFRKVGDVMEFSRMTPAYLDNLAKKTDGKLNLQGKILFVEELRGIQNAQAPKLLISEKRLLLRTVDVNRESVELEVLGPPTIITTTTQAALEDPNSRTGFYR